MVIPKYPKTSEITLMKTGRTLLLFRLIIGNDAMANGALNAINIARILPRTILISDNWPMPYIATVPTKEIANADTNTVEKAPKPFLRNAAEAAIQNIVTIAKFSIKKFGSILV